MFDFYHGSRVHAHVAMILVVEKAQCARSESNFPSFDSDWESRSLGVTSSSSFSFTSIVQGVASSIFTSISLVPLNE